MSFANFGIGVGAFTQGLRNGMQLGREVRQVRNERQIEKMHEQGIGAATASRDQEIEGRIEKTGVEGRDDFMGDVTTGYKVGDKTYGDEGAARDQASQGVDSVMDYFMRDTAPRIGETYVQQGDIQKAELWSKWVSDRKGQKAVTDWAKAYTAARSGDWGTAADGFGEYYTQYIDDGVDYRGHELVRGDGGEIAGMKIELLDNDTGETHSMELSTSDLVELGMAHNPQTLFDMAYSQQTKADEARLEMARDTAKDRRQFANQAAMEGIKQGNRLERDTYQSNLSASENSREVNEKVRMLEESGYDRDFIDSMMPAIIGIGEYKKQASPEEVARMIHQERLKASGPYGEYGRMSPDQQRELINKDMQMFYDIGDTYGNRNRQGNGGGGQSSPASGGLWYNPNTSTN